MSLTLAPGLAAARVQPTPGAAVAEAVRDRDDAGPHLVADLERHLDRADARGDAHAVAVGEAARRARRRGAAAPCSGRRPSSAARCCAATSCSSAAGGGRSASRSKPSAQRGLARGGELARAARPRRRTPRGASRTRLPSRAQRAGQPRLERPEVDAVRGPLDLAHRQPAQRPALQHAVGPGAQRRRRRARSGVASQPSEPQRAARARRSRRAQPARRAPMRISQSVLAARRRLGTAAGL